MCEECRRSPCLPNCPNAPEPEPVYICDSCEEGIYDGDAVYEIGGNYYCEICIDKARFIAETPEPYNPLEDEDRIYDEWRDRQLWESERNV